MAETESDRIRELEAKICSQNEEIEALKYKLAFYERNQTLPTVSFPTPPSSLTNEDILRYSRQMILPEFRPAGQKLLKGSSALVVGCGGLGCPSALYLAAAGLGKVGLVDHDTVELSNLHRQVGHTQTRIGVSKAVSLATTLSSLNPSVEIVTYEKVMDSTTAMDLITGYDIVLDCTDNVATRYLLNDACVILEKPLVSGSALRWEGQLTVYNYERGPTYRCLYPTPPPAEAVTNCSDGGVMGAVVGVIGCMQALETIKILAGKGTELSGKMLLFDGLEGRVRTMKLRGRREGKESEVTQLIDYVQFCGAAPTDKEVSLELLSEIDRITARELGGKIGTEECLVIDVRTEPEVEMCFLEGTVNIPLGELQYEATREKNKEMLEEKIGEKDVYVVCRRGNDSQVGVEILRKMLPGVRVRDVVGGLHAWTRDVDNSFPIY